MALYRLIHILSVMSHAPFVFSGENLALDLLNTASGAAERDGDRLASPMDVVRWLVEAELLSTSEKERFEQSPPDTRLLWEEALRFRCDARDALQAWLRGAQIPEGSLFALNRCLEALTTALRLRTEGHELRLETTRRHTGTAGYLAPVAKELADLLLGGSPTRVRQCAGDGCGLWFRDTSKNGSRRWCSMARCGNRAKVAAHYRRSKAKSGSTD